MRRLWASGFVVALALIPRDMAAQESAAPEEDGSDAAPEEALLSDAELQTLVAPVALYPDTLLIQILVASTEPLQVIKADNFLDDNAGREPSDLAPEIEAEGWDPSVAVLAEAFPTVIADMATHIEWTETMGDAMLAQSDDVMDAVQVMRDQAIDSGALISGDEMTLVSDENDNVVVAPTDPEVVYVPDYDPDVVYLSDSDSGTSTGDLLLAGAIGFGTYALIDAIWDDSDDYYRYWGCRNCAGWGGYPIIRQPPRGDISVGGDREINIEGGDREVNIDRDTIDFDRDEIVWKPDPGRQDAARDKIADRRGEDGASTLPVDRPDRSDDLRATLSDRSGAADISRPDHGGVDLPSIERPTARLPEGDRSEALRNTGAAAAVGGAAVGAGALAGQERDGAARARLEGAERPGAIERPQNIQRPASVERPASIQRPPGQSSQALKQRAPAAKARAGGHRGHAGRAGGPRGRR